MGKTGCGEDRVVVPFSDKTGAPIKVKQEVKQEVKQGKTGTDPCLNRHCSVVKQGRTLI